MDYDFPRHVGAVVVYVSDWGNSIPLVRNEEGNWVSEWDQSSDPKINDLMMFDMRKSTPGYYPLCFDSIEDYNDYKSWKSLEKGLGLACDEINRKKAS